MMAKRVRSARVLPPAAFDGRRDQIVSFIRVRISRHGEGRKILWITLWVEDISKYALLDLRLITEI
jgi:hypothetical protein